MAVVALVACAQYSHRGVRPTCGATFVDIIMNIMSYLPVAPSLFLHVKGANWGSILLQLSVACWRCGIKVKMASFLVVSLMREGTDRNEGV